MKILTKLRLQTFFKGSVLRRKNTFFCRLTERKILTRKRTFYHFLALYTSPPGRENESTEIVGIGKIFPSDRMAANFCKSSSVAFIPHGHPSLSTPIKRYPGLPQSGISFANAQTASPNLSLSVVDLVRSTRYVSVIVPYAFTILYDWRYLLLVQPDTPIA